VLGPDHLYYVQYSPTQQTFTLMRIRYAEGGPESVLSLGSLNFFVSDKIAASATHLYWVSAKDTHYVRISRMPLVGGKSEDVCTLRPSADIASVADLAVSSDGTIYLLWRSYADGSSAWDEEVVSVRDCTIKAQPTGQHLGSSYTSVLGTCQRVTLRPAQRPSWVLTTRGRAASQS
jgi:hypothetical protein